MVEGAQKVLVTGGARGIGKAICERYAAAGWSVWAPTRLELDLASHESVEAFLARHGDLGVHALVNNAGENTILPFEELPYEDWARMQHVNLNAAFMLSQRAVGFMAAQGGGRIVNISSCYGVVGRAGRAAYTSSKAGLNGLTVAMAVELGVKNILVNAVCPGFVETDLTRQNNSPEQIQALAGMTALKRLAQPSEIAELVHFLGSSLNTFITGQAILIDGGFTCQ